MWAHTRLSSMLWYWIGASAHPHLISNTTSCRTFRIVSPFIITSINFKTQKSKPIIKCQVVSYIGYSLATACIHKETIINYYRPFLYSLKCVLTVNTEMALTIFYNRFIMLLYAWLWEDLVLSEKSWCWPAVPLMNKW